MHYLHTLGTGCHQCQNVLGWVFCFLGLSSKILFRVFQITTGQCSSWVTSLKMQCLRMLEHMHGKGCMWPSVLGSSQCMCVIHYLHTLGTGCHQCQNVLDWVFCFLGFVLKDSFLSLSPYHTIVAAAWCHWKCNVCACLNTCTGKGTCDLVCWGHVSDALFTHTWYWMPSVTEFSGQNFLFSGFHLERFFFESLKLSLPFSIVIVVDSDCHCKDSSYKNISMHFLSISWTVFSYTAYLYLFVI